GAWPARTAPPRPSSGSTPATSTASTAGDGGVFDGFTLDRGDVGEAVLRVRHGGGGRPRLLLPRHHPPPPAAGGAPAGRLPPRGLPRPARLRPVDQAADHPRPPALLQAGHGRRLPGPDGRPRPPA